TICSGFGEYTQVFKTKDPILRGSYIEKTKIISPTEYDFLNILSLFEEASVEVCDVRDGCKLAGQGYGVVNIHPGQVQKQLHITATGYKVLKSQSSHAFLLRPPPTAYLLTAEMRHSLHAAMHTYLENTNGSHYIGMKDLKNKQPPSYTLGEFSMNEHLHGPSVWLRVGGPLGTTDIDLCFCIQKTQGSVLVPLDPGGCIECPKGIHWTESIVQTPHQAPDCQLHIPTGHHKQLFLVLKYISHLFNKIHWHVYHKHPYDGLISSYSYKLLIMHHQKSCTGSDFNVGRCLEDVVEYIFNQFGGDDDNDSYQYMIRYFYKETYLPDTDYPIDR
ncbi:unnamed protein product, partial [Owenia fusiformis]